MVLVVLLALAVRAKLAGARVTVLAAGLVRLTLGGVSLTTVTLTAAEVAVAFLLSVTLAVRL